MSDLKTKPTEESVVAFLNSVENETRRKDAFRIHELMTAITGEKATMWGPGIVGYGTYHYIYKTGREGDWLLTGFSPRKQSLSLYIMSGFSRYDDLLAQLGKHKTGVSCLYINKLSDIDMDVLSEMIKESVAYMRNKKWP
ncbi:MAG: DUF1801 domain-containing protein [Cyclobacteriaceae bacterium]